MEKFWTTRYLKSGTIIFSVIFLSLLYKEITIFSLKHLDSVMYVEALANTVEKGQPVTTSNKTIRDAASMFAWKPEKICAEDTFEFEGSERNVLDNHAYYMNFPISIFANFLDAEVVVATVHVLQFVVQICGADQSDHLILKRHLQVHDRQYRARIVPQL